MTFPLPMFVGGMPGGMELAVIFLIFVLFFVPIGLVLLGVWYLLGRRTSATTLDERIDDLEAEVAELRQAVDETTDSRDASDTKDSSDEPSHRP